MAKTSRAIRRVYVTQSKARRRSRPSLSLAVVAGFAPTLAFAIEGFKLPGDQGGIVEAAHRVTMRMTGYEWKNNKWIASELAMGVGPLLLGGLVHKMANKMGINKTVRKATMGFLSI